MGTAINPVNTNIVYAVSNAGGIYKSTAGGATGTFAVLPNTPPITDVGKLVMDFTTPTTLYAFEGTGLYQTLDGGNTWPVFGPPDNNSRGWSCRGAVGFEYGGGGAVGGAVPWITKNAQSGGGDVARRASADNRRVDRPIIERIVIDPANPNQLYALQGNGSAAAPLLVSSDGGMSWQARNFGPNVVDIPRDLVVDPDLPNTLYLGHGFFRLQEFGRRRFLVPFGIRISAGEHYQPEPASRGQNPARGHYRARRLGSGCSHHGSPAQWRFAHRGELRIPADGEWKQFRAELGDLAEWEPADHLVLEQHTIDGGGSHELDYPFHGVQRVRQHAWQRRRALGSGAHLDWPDDLPQWRSECGRSGLGDLGFPDEFFRGGIVARHVRGSVWFAVGGGSGRGLASVADDARRSAGAGKRNRGAPILCFRCSD